MTDPDQRLTRLHQRAAATERQLEQIEELMAQLPLGALAAFGSTLAEHEARLNTLEER